MCFLKNSTSFFRFITHGLITRLYCFVEIVSDINIVSTASNGIVPLTARGMNLARIRIYSELIFRL